MLHKKLEDSRYQVVKINGTLRKFAQGQFSGVFKRTDMPQETRDKLDKKKKQLLGKARSGNAAAQAELADLLELINDKPESEYSLVSRDKIVSAANLPKIRLEQRSIAPFSPNSAFAQEHYNLKFLVWLDAQGNLTRQQAFDIHADVPNALRERALTAMSSWQVEMLSKGNVKAENGPYMAEFYYNNEARSKEFSNHLTRSHTTLKPIVNRPELEQARYWRLQAAQAGHVESLMLLGANCNMTLLSVAAKMQYTPAKTLAAKCLLNRVTTSKAQLEQAKSWLLSASEDGDYVAMREIAGVYARHSHNRGELERAIELATAAGDETDDPWAFEYMAAAYAKLGLFDEAIDAQKDAIKKGWNRDYNVERSEQRLAAYENSELAAW